MAEINKLPEHASTIPSTADTLDDLLKDRRLSLKTSSGINRAAKSVLHLFGGDLTTATSAVLEWHRSNKKVKRSTFRYRREQFAQEKYGTGKKVHTGPIVNYEDEI